MALLISGCVWAPMLETRWSENYALNSNGGIAEYANINDGKLDTVAYTPKGKPRRFVIKFVEQKRIRKLVIHNYNLYHFDLQYWDTENMEWKTFRQIRQRRDVAGMDSRVIQPKYEIGRLNFVTDRIRIDVSRTVDDESVVKYELDKGDKVLNRIRKNILGRYTEYYKVLKEHPAGVREIEIYGLAK